MLDIGSFPKDELARRASLVTLLFRLEQQSLPEGLAELAQEINDWFGKHEGHERLHGLFTELIREACGRCGVILPKSSNLLEMKPMILSGFDAWKNQIHVEAKAEGTALGRAEGKAEGLADALISLLARRFGSVAPACQTRIQGAGLVTLEHWFDRAIDAPDLPSIFDPPR